MSLQLERELYDARLKTVVLFARSNHLNSIYTSSPNDSVGIIAAGKTYYDVLESFSLLGLDKKNLNKFGIRVLKLQMIYPMEPEILEQFADGLNKILVIEEKRGFIELLVRDALFNLLNHPKIIGKHDLYGKILVPANGELVVRDIVEILLRVLIEVLPEEISLTYKDRVYKTTSSMKLALVNEVSTSRSPYFCSGCPHNRSTNVPDGSISGGGIGCHGLTLLMERNTIGLLHMGGEGIPWVGAESFSSTDHMFQNMGDGTLFHSGYLAIRQAVASNSSITYKILYNSVVAMTGGQNLDGGMSVPELTRAIEAEGVKEIIVCSHDVKKYPRGSKWAKKVTIWDRSKLEKAQLRLREVKGVTVLIYDQPCTADLRRKRKRNLLPTPETQIFINELVCEGCGDCGIKSNCLSVLPVETEFGRKTQVHQSSCNRDYTCLDGDCPAFVSVISKSTSALPKCIVEDNIFDFKISKPDTQLINISNIYMVGIGGTGVVTINQILATAAFLDGKYSTNLDQTGLSQKGGSVISHVKLSGEPPEISNRVPRAEANAFILFDILAGVSDANLAYTHPEKTIAVVSNSRIPTGHMVKSKDILFPETNYLLSRLDGHVKELVKLDSLHLSENLFGTHMQANMIMIGAAYQAGAIPITQESIFKAIELNGIAININKKAFFIGRLSVHDPLNYLQSIEFSRQGQITLNTVISHEARLLIGSVNSQGELLDVI
ncbi:MAG: indolepyruvate ferredoxin oxidoreductase family protein, partial [Candidatus Heimdallarchaeota archaeon]